MITNEYHQRLVDRFDLPRCAQLILDIESRNECDSEGEPEMSFLGRLILELSDWRINFALMPEKSITLCCNQCIPLI